jgi:methylmalonyl-CoA mutase N-terminal domain/subunit
MVEAVKRNYPQREIADAAFVLQQEIDAGDRIVVGINAHTEGDDGATPNLLECARVHASEGEIVGALQDVFGTYTETPVF